MSLAKPYCQSMDTPCPIGQGFVAAGVQAKLACLIRSLSLGENLLLRESAAPWSVSSINFSEVELMLQISGHMATAEEARICTFNLSCHKCVRNDDTCAPNNTLRIAECIPTCAKICCTTWNALDNSQRGWTRKQKQLDRRPLVVDLLHTNVS